ncbi:MAG: cadherin-like domain-containing protein, partial [Deinococcota bacterium]|nr:cadherin-like domain-containing protein [Deinococcota bacterium]
MTNLGRPVTINVLANDEDPDGDPLTVTVVSNPANGSAAINEGATVTYTPNEGFVGTDAFTYEIADGRGGAATATVTVQVSAFNEVHYLPGMRTLVYHQGRFYHV